ncbi:lipocalin-like domain-containing protein [Williamsia sp. MIQD14]|uniref:lipocalin-like domain-containing protein n=1 Tax=Williamsia sp. MIQD14 TaxID=3425703 RepID=UPI003DA09FC7
MSRTDLVEAWNGPGRADGSLTDVRPEHNALHASTKLTAFEHWYFDAALDNGYTVVGFLTKRRPEDLPRSRPWVEIILYGPEGSRRQIAQRYPARECSFSVEKCDVTVGENFAYVTFHDELPTYTVHFAEDDVVIDLEFANEIAPWMPGQGETHFGNGEIFGWCVGGPRAKVTGRLSIGAKRWEVTGTGYADHNWGVGDMRKVIDRWHWGRLYVEDYSLLYAVVLTQEGYGSHQIAPVMVADGAEVILSSGEAVLEEGPLLPDADAGRDYPSWISLTIPGRLELRLDVRTVLHGHDLLGDIPVVGSKVLRPLVSRLVGHPGYFRFASDFRLAVTRDDGRVDVRTGTTLHELVALR